MTEEVAITNGRSFSEGKRKVVHVGLGLIAFALGILPWWLAAAIACCAIVFNALLLPRLGGEAISRRAAGTDTGIVLYPVSVFVLIVLFRDTPVIAAVGWLALAFGDGLATVAGTTLGGPKLPWNRAKSLAGAVAFVGAGVASAWAATLVIGAPDGFVPLPVVISVAIAAAAIVETIPTGIDDNLTVPFTAASTMWALLQVSAIPAVLLAPGVTAWLVVNLVLALAGYLAGTVNASGFAGGACIGWVVILFGGWQLYVVLLAFFVIGSGATKAGIRRKTRMGLAQEGGGRRGFSHAFANTGAATILAFLAATTGLDGSALWLAAVAALATAAADTTGSEIGQLIGRRPFMPLTFKRVAPGTEGAISIEGTAAGAVAALAMGVAGALLWQLRHTGTIAPAEAVVPAATVAMAAIVASWLESVAGSWNRARTSPVSNGTLNFMNTAAGAALLLGFLELFS